MSIKSWIRTAAFAAACVFAQTAFASGWGALSDPGDVRSMGDTPKIDIRSAEAFAEGHIPGAINAPYGLWRGPKENPGRVPDEATLQTLLQSLGLEHGGDVLIIHEGKNATDFGAAARVYWTLKSAGFESLSILNGGHNAWVADGGKLETGAVTPASSDIEIRFSDTWMIDREGVGDVVAGNSEAVLIDARPLDFFTGDKKHGAATEAGTLETALNIVHSTWFGAGSPVLDAQSTDIEMIRKVAAENAGAPLVSFCNTGHWAATNWFAASELAGIEGVKLYPESMVGWTLLGGAVVNGEG